MEKSKIRLTLKEIYDFCIKPVWGPFTDYYLLDASYKFDLKGLANSNYTQIDIDNNICKYSNSNCHRSVSKLLPELIKQKEIELYNNEFVGLLKDD